MFKIYHNTRCRKSRAGLQYLEEKGLEFEIINYLNDPLDEETLKRLLMKLNQKPSEIVRTQEEVYKKQLKGKEFSDDEWIRILLENPKLIHRPIVEGEYKAVIGNPPENIDLLLK